MITKILANTQSTARPPQRNAGRDFCLASRQRRQALLLRFLFCLTTAPAVRAQSRFGAGPSGARLLARRWRVQRPTATQRRLLDRKENLLAASLPRIFLRGSIGRAFQPRPMRTPIYSALTQGGQCSILKNKIFQFTFAFPMPEL